MNTDTLLIDFGGVIGSHAPRLFLKEFAVKFDVELDDAIASFKKNMPLWQKGQITEDEFWKLFQMDLNLPQPEETFINTCKELLRFFVTVNNELLNYLADYKKKHEDINLVLFSNCGKELSEYIEKEYALSDVFDVTLYSGVIGAAKPDKKAFERALDSVGVSANQCLFIDDKEANIAAATALGIPSLLFTSTDECITAIEKIRTED